MGDLFQRTYFCMLHNYANPFLCPLTAYETSKRRVMILNLPSIPDHFSEAERSLHLSAIVPYDKINVVSVGLY